MNYELSWAFRLSPSGFPLYLFPLRSKRMPLQSLTHWRRLKPSKIPEIQKSVNSRIPLRRHRGDVSTVNGQQSIVNSQWSIVNSQWSTVNGQQSIVNGQKKLSVFIFRTFNFFVIFERNILSEKTTIKIK